VALCSTALQCICRVIRRSSMTMKAHTYYIIFGRPPIGGSFPFPPLAAPLYLGLRGGELARPDTGLAIIYNCFKTFAFQLGIHCDSPAANVFGLHRLEWPCLPERIKVYLGKAVCSLAGLVVVSAVHSVSRMFNF